MKKYNLSTTETPTLLDEIQRKAGYFFKNMELLNEALTHPSYAAEQHGPMRNNQRLEFLGDAVLQIIMSDYLYKQLPNEQEGTLTRVRSYLVNEPANAGYSRVLHLDMALLLGHGEIMSGGRERSSILGDVFESFLGAMYLDGGIAPCTKLVLSLLPPIDVCMQKLKLEENPKGSLQQWSLAHKQGNVSYVITGQRGPVHDPVYMVNALIGGKVVGSGEGHSHKEAERNAALKALVQLTTEETQSTAPADAPEAPHADAQPQAPQACKVPAPRRRRVFALDFDGVICDSAAETAASAWRAAQVLWPKEFPVGSLVPQDILEAFRASRPYLETGYQSILMIKHLRNGGSPQDFSQNFAERIAELMAQTKTTKEQLVALFGKTRDNWLKEDLQGWLNRHTCYPHTIDALKAALAHHDVMILTTKQERFVQAILKNAGVDFPKDAIYGLDRGLKKEAILEDLVQQNRTNIHFVEDRLETLQRIKALKNLTRVKLHYADWGYGTPESLADAQADKRMNVMSLIDFKKLLED